jgi:MFS family permease
MSTVVRRPANSGLNSGNRRLLGLIVVATFFEGYDRAILGLALKYIGSDLRVGEDQLGTPLALIGLGSIAAIVVAVSADRFGRSRMLLVTVLGYTVSTLLTALSRSTSELVVWQFFSRVFVSAELSIATVVVAEILPAASRAYGVGTVGAVAALGYGFASLMFVGVEHYPFGWRFLYLVGIAPLFVIAYLRRGLPETDRWLRVRQERPAGPALRGILTPLVRMVGTHPARFVSLALVAFLFRFSWEPGYTFVPYFAQTKHGLTSGSVAMMYSLGGALGIVGGILGGKMSDRMGRRPIGTVCFVVLVVSLCAYYNGPRGLLLPAWIGMVTFGSAASIMILSYSTELFSTSYRASAATVIAAIGTAGGSVGLFVEGFGVRALGSTGGAVTALSVSLVPATLVFLMACPETSQRELEQISADPVGDLE